MQASDFLISNGGRLDPTWFEPHDLETGLLPAWLSAATGGEELVEAAVYARAFETLVSLVMSEPAQQRDRDKASAFTDRQLSYWEAQAAYWRGRADALAGNSGPALVGWEGDPVWRN